MRLVRLVPALKLDEEGKFDCAFLRAITQIHEALEKAPHPAFGHLLPASGAKAYLPWPLAKRRVYQIRADALAPLLEELMK